MPESHTRNEHGTNSLYRVSVGGWNDAGETWVSVLVSKTRLKMSALASDLNLNGHSHQETSCHSPIKTSKNLFCACLVIAPLEEKITLL